MPLKPRKASKPRTEVKEFEHDMSGQLAAVGKEMAEKYDLSEETAKAKSVGVKGFKSHKLLDAKGYAKLGGMQRDGSVAVDRYISYRRGKDIVSLSVFLLKDQPVEAHEFHVIAPAGPARRRQAGGGNSSRPRPKRRSSPPTAGWPSRICRALPRHSTRRWRRSRPEFQNRHCAMPLDTPRPASGAIHTRISRAEPHPFERSAKQSSSLLGDRWIASLRSQ